MICLVSLVVFSVLGIFSAKYRELAKQAFECVRSKGSGKDCEPDFDREIRNKVIGKAMDIDVRLASFVESHFALLSFLFLLLLVGSFLASGLGIYNWIVHGNCLGAEATTGCSFNQGAGLLEKLVGKLFFWN